ncbi:MAG: hypothetical protein ABFD49_06905 [Armatimonadota bacterium]
MARIYIIAIMLFLAAASAAPCTEEAKYRVTELEIPAEAMDCYPAAINNAGVVVGGNASVTLWQNGHYTDLGKLVHETSLSCSATAINDKGTVVGFGDIGPQPNLTKKSTYTRGLSAFLECTGNRAWLLEYLKKDDLEYVLDQMQTTVQYIKSHIGVDVKLPSIPVIRKKSLPSLSRFAVVSDRLRQILPNCVRRRWVVSKVD